MKWCKPAIPIFIAITNRWVKKWYIFRCISRCTRDHLESLHYVRPTYITEVYYFVIDWWFINSFALQIAVLLRWNYVIFNTLNWRAISSVDFSYATVKNYNFYSAIGENKVGFDRNRRNTRWSWSQNRDNVELDREYPNAMLFGLSLVF